MALSEYYRDIREKIGDALMTMPSVNAIVVNNEGEVLLQRRTDNGQWNNPGGAIEPGELPVHAVIREVKEETGLDVEPVRITGVYGGPEYMVTYPNGDRVAIVSISFLCRVVGGEPGGDPDETLETRWFAPDALPEMAPRFTRRIRDALNGSGEATYQTGNQ